MEKQFYDELKNDPKFAESVATLAGATAVSAAAGVPTTAGTRLSELTPEYQQKILETEIVRLDRELEDSLLSGAVSTEADNARLALIKQRAVYQARLVRLAEDATIRRDASKNTQPGGYFTARKYKTRKVNKQTAKNSRRVNRQRSIR